MKALFRKQFEQALIPAAVVAVIAALLIGSDRNLQITLKPNADGAPLIVALLWGFFGLLVGFAGFALEESRDTRAYWMHRGVGARRLFAVKTIAELAALALALLVVIAVNAVSTTANLDSSFDAPPMYGRYLELVIGAASTLLGHALGSLGAQMRRPVVVRLLSTAFGGCGAVLLTAVWQIHMGEPRMDNVLAWLVWMLGGAAWLYALARRSFVQGPDEDRALAGATRPAFALTALALGGPVCVMVVALVQRHAVFEAVRRLPWVAYADGKANLHDANESSNQRWDLAIFDPLDRPEPHAPVADAWVASLASGLSPFAFGDEWRTVTNTPVRRDTTAGVLNVTAYFGARTGRVLARAARWRSPPAAIDRGNAVSGAGAPYSFEVVRGDGKRFSRSVAAFPPRDSATDWALFDAQDRTLWRLSFATEVPQLVRIELPGADRPLGADADVRAGAEHDSWSWRLGGSTRVVRGESARYRWNGTRFEAYAAENGRQWLSEFDSTSASVLDVVHDDLLAPSVVVRDPHSGAVLLEHEYEPRAMFEGLACALSTMRPPLGLLASTSRERTSGIRDLDLVFDPLVANGRRPWLVAINLALSALLAWAFARRRLLGLRWTWILVLAVLGPSVIAIAYVIEPRTRRKTQPLATQSPVIRELAQEPLETAAV